jgi:putative acetyltransferase
MHTLDTGAAEERSEAHASSPKTPTNARPSEAVEIIEYDPQYREAFKQLNLEWIAHYFAVEKADQVVLADPERYILQPGGYIFFARYDGQIVGTCALIKHHRGRFELAKMAVTPRCRGRGIGGKLAAAAVQKVRSLGEQRLFLETNRRLLPAMALYKKIGFRERAYPHRHPRRYRRADTYMVIDL